MSKAYYNEFDKKAAAWLRELIKRGLIADGDVDERSINDVRATDLTGYTQCHFFAGIGGWSLALRLAGWPDDRPVWTGSCPCQPFSVAGKGLGTADERHLWPVFAGLVAECKPPVAFGEQVASRAGREWLAGVRADLEAMGYEVGAADLCAAGVGAPHIRQRLYWMADARHQQAWRSAAPGQAQGGRSFGDASGCGDGCRLADTPQRGQRIDRSASRATGHNDERGKDGWSSVVYAADCDEDGNCPNCGIDYAECGCFGPTQDGVEYEERDGVIYGRWMDNSEQPGLERFSRNGNDGNESGRIDPIKARSTPETSRDCWSRYDLIPCGDGKARRIEPGLAPLAHGIPARVVRLRGYGNAIVPQVAAAFIRASVEALA